MVLDSSIPFAEKQLEIANERQLYFDKTNSSTFSGFIRLVAGLIGGAFYLYFLNIGKPGIDWLLIAVPVVATLACVGGIIVILENWKWFLDVRTTELKLLNISAPHATRIASCGTEQVQMYLMIAVAILSWILCWSVLNFSLDIIFGVLGLLSIVSFIIIRRFIKIEREKLSKKIANQIIQPTQKSRAADLPHKSTFQNRKTVR